MAREKIIEISWQKAIGLVTARNEKPVERCFAAFAQSFIHEFSPYPWQLQTTPEIGMNYRITTEKNLQRLPVDVKIKQSHLGKTTQNAIAVFEQQHRRFVCQVVEKGLALNEIKLVHQIIHGVSDAIIELIYRHNPSNQLFIFLRTAAHK